MYVIVVGAGDIGTPLVELGTRTGHDIVVIERDEQKAQQISKEYDCLVLNEDATRNETLAEAGAEEADAIVSTTDVDATNIMVCLLAEEFAVPSIVSVVHDPEHMPVFRKIGVNTIENPQRLIAEYLFRAISRPAVVDFMRIGDEAEVFEITVREDAPIAGLSLTEVGQQSLLSDDDLIVAIERDGVADPITPRGKTRVEPGDLVTVYSATGATAALTDVFGHHEDHTR
ncbi:potassium channel family protein [Salinarchaeum laminariae]|uniref:potassium channel family protein n=1 Tax=Salinarchaeum laminariae TaxID=869888 RepID=UPI0020BF21D6|nr:TrkA family potassium uptake protein [Salinarchaeum laminariae]